MTTLTNLDIVGFIDWSVDHFNHFGVWPGSYVFKDNDGNEVELSEQRVCELHVKLGHFDIFNKPDNQYSMTTEVVRGDDLYHPSGLIRHYYMYDSLKLLARSIEARMADMNARQCSVFDERLCVLINRCYDEGYSLEACVDCVMNTF